MTELDPWLKAVGRGFLSVIFLWAGYEKIVGYAGAQDYMEAANVPAELLPLVILAELGGGLAILLGWQTRWAALALAGFCLLAGALFHIDPGNRVQTIMLLKNIAMAGGFLVLAAAGPGALSLDARRERRI